MFIGGFIWRSNAYIVSVKLVSKTNIVAWKCFIYMCTYKFADMINRCTLFLGNPIASWGWFVKIKGHPEPKVASLSISTQAKMVGRTLVIPDDISGSGNWPNSQIAEYTRSISHNAPFRPEMCTFLFEIKHFGFVKLVYFGWIDIGACQGHFICIIGSRYSKIKYGKILHMHGNDE